MAVSDHQWDSGKYDEADGAYFERDWGVISLHKMFLVSCTFSPVSSIFELFSSKNVSISSYYMAGDVLDRPHPFLILTLPIFPNISNPFCIPSLSYKKLPGSVSYYASAYPNTPIFTLHFLSIKLSYDCIHSAWHHKDHRLYVNHKTLQLRVLQVARHSGEGKFSVFACGWRLWLEHKYLKSWPACCI